jgi:hypothetical protein
MPATTVIEAIALPVGAETNFDERQVNYNMKEGGTTADTTHHIGTTKTGKSENATHSAISSPAVAPSSVISNPSSKEEWEEIVQRFRNYCANDMNLEDVILMTRNYPDLLPGMISVQVTKQSVAFFLLTTFF